MKILGTIKGEEFVLDKDDGQQALTLVKSIPSPDNPDTRMIQLEVDLDLDGDGNFEYLRGDILTSDGTKWSRVMSPVDTVGGVTDLKCPRIGCDVQLRWNDPVDTDEYTWKHTLIMRKHGGVPNDIHDGVVVTDSYVRNQYARSSFHDILPGGTETGWMYRIFTFSDDEVYHSDIIQDVFEPIELTWRNFNAYIRAGLGKRMFAVGDAIIVNDSTKDFPYNSLTFVVVGFDLASPVDLTLKRSVTFMVESTLGYKTTWDNKWNEYVLTSDVFVMSRTKKYYITNDGVHFIPAPDLPLGSKIPANTYYEWVKKSEDDNPPRLINGGNRWSHSALRLWLNSSNPDDMWTFIREDDQYNPKQYRPPLTQLPQEVVDAITPIRVATALPSADGVDCEITTDKLFLFSATEVFDESAIRISYSATTDSYPKEDKEYYVIDGSEYRLATDADYTEDHEFIKGKTYFERTVIVNNEGLYIEHFEDKDLEPRAKYDPLGIKCSWWLRSANVNDECKVQFVNNDDYNTRNAEGSNSFSPAVRDGNMHNVVFGFVVA